MHQSLVHLSDHSVSMAKAMGASIRDSECLGRLHAGERSARDALDTSMQQRTHHFAYSSAIRTASAGSERSASTYHKNPSSAGGRTSAGGPRCAAQFRSCVRARRMWGSRSFTLRHAAAGAHCVASVSPKFAGRQQDCTETRLGKQSASQPAANASPPALAGRRPYPALNRQSSPCPPPNAGRISGMGCGGMYVASSATPREKRCGQRRQ